jgi:radical SAM protein with 4Fe4S-binding SPASM domain
MIYDKYKKVHPDKRIKSIMVPTNYTFILKDELIEYAEDIISKFSDIGIRVDLSASFDGKFLDSSNRPLKTVINSNGKIKEPRDDQYYNKVFEFSRRHNFGFHPMVYSNKIEEWKDNFLWFQKKLKEHDMDWKNIYLLEVRNAEWTSQQIIEFGKFMKFLIYYAWEKVGENELDYKNFLFEGRGFNILSGPLSRIGRGLGCSIQSSFYVRLGDLTVNPCHRTMYPGFEYFKFKTMDDRIVGIESVNPELMTTIYSTDFSNQPYCEQCGINNICTKGCLGAQYEVTGDLFTPIPTVCELEHVKILSMIEAYQEIGIKPWRYSDENIKSQWENMVKLKKENDIEMGGI